MVVGMRCWEEVGRGCRAWSSTKGKSAFPWGDSNECGKMQKVKRLKGPCLRKKVDLDGRGTA